MRIFRSRTKTHKPLTHKAFVLWVPLCLLAALSLFIPSASTISEENVDVNVNLVNGVAIRILNSAATAEITELDLSATAAPTGTFVTDNFKVEVSTANKTGYKLYMNSSYQNPSTSTYTTDLVNQTNTSYTIPTVAADTTKSALSTAAPGTTNANKWAYSLDDATYSPVPANSVQTQIGSHDTPTAGTKTPVYIGMNVNVEKPSGVYKNQLTFSAVGNPVPTDYSLYFEPGGTGVSGLPETMTASEVSASHTFTIPSAAPTRTGYNFTGYSDGASTYQPGDTITVQGDIDYTGSATLTAEWELASYTITISNTNTSSGSASISVPYGGSNTVTVTPNTGHYLSSVSCPSGYTCTGYSTGTSATGQQTVTVTNNNTAGGGTLGFVGTARTFTVSVSNTHTTSGANSISVPYGGSNTVTVTPSSGYYLSAVSCPSGYTCSGYGTGTSYTGQQTVTVTNNSTTSGGTLSFTGAALTLAQMCNNASTGGTFYYGSIQYIKLKTNSTGTTTACYTKTSQGTATFDNAATLCPSDTGVPSQSEFQSLINAYGSDGTIYNTTGWYGNYWSSTSGDDGAWRLEVYSSAAYFFYTGNRTASNYVVCIVR